MTSPYNQTTIEPVTEFIVKHFAVSTFFKLFNLIFFQIQKGRFLQSIKMNVSSDHEFKRENKFVMKYACSTHQISTLKLIIFQLS
jgi:hypothetical protein